MRSIDRLPTPETPAARLESAQLDREADDTTEVQVQLRDLADENVAESPEALVALVDVRHAANQPIDPKTAMLVAAYAQELRNTPLGPSMRRAHVISLAKSGQFDAAFEAFLDLGGKSGEATDAELLASMLRTLTQEADDIVFLEHALDREVADLAALSPADRIAFSRRMNGLGFPLKAEQFLASLPERPRRDDRQLLAAEIALSLDKPMKALADLLEVEGEAANLLRAKAKRASGAHEDAHRLFAEAAQEQHATETAWLAPNWRDLTLADSPVFGPAAGLPPVAPIDRSRDGMLSRSTAALEESAQTRETLRALLQSDELRPTVEDARP